MSDLQSRELFLQRYLTRRAPELREYVRQRIPPIVAAHVNPDDILQEAWVAAFRRIAVLRMEDEVAVDYWVISIVNRKLLDALRLAQAKKRGGAYTRVPEPRRSSSMAGVLGLLASPERTPSRMASDKEASRAVRGAVARLDEECRQAIRMRFVEGLPPREIARRMRKSAPFVSTLLFRALRELRYRLGHAAKFFSDARSDEGGAAEHHAAESADGTTEPAATSQPV